jgi:hypothetical protein
LPHLLQIYQITLDFNPRLYSPSIAPCPVSLPLPLPLGGVLVDMRSKLGQGAISRQKPRSLVS